MKEQIHHRFTIITCSGLSNTGKLTTQAAIQLLREDPSTFDQVFKGSRPIGDLIQAASEAEHVLILDGCTDTCAAKKLQAAGIDPDLHIIATECGIEKNGQADPRFSEISKFSAAVREKIRQ